MTGKITIESAEENIMRVDLNLRNVTHADKFCLVDTLITSLGMDELELAAVATLIVIGKIGRKNTEGKTVISVDGKTIREMLNGD